MNQVVKNLNVTPTSQILLSAYNDEISLKDKNVSNVLMKRLEKKYKLNSFRSRSIIESDYQIFKCRGNNVSSYAFMEGHTLSDTLNIIYQNLLPIEPDFDIHKCFSHLTFSELALMPIIFEKLTHSYKKRLDLSQDIDVSDEDHFLESQLQDYYSFFKKVTQEHLLLQADYKTNISMYAIFKMMRICDYESTKVLTNDSLLFNDLEEIVDNPNAATVDRRLIKKYPGSECIFQYRNGGR